VYWQEHVHQGEVRLGAATESREAWLAEHGETTLALLQVEAGLRANELDELRGELIAKADERPAGELADRDACVRADLAALQPAVLRPPAPDLDVGFDLGP